MQTYYLRQIDLSPPPVIHYWLFQGGGSDVVLCCLILVLKFRWCFTYVCSLYF